MASVFTLKCCVYLEFNPIYEVRKRAKFHFQEPLVEMSIFLPVGDAFSLTYELSRCKWISVWISLLCAISLLT